MPMNRKLYPSDWRDIALAIKAEVNWTCEGCGKPCRHPGEAIADFANRIGVPVLQVSQSPKRYELGVVHLDHRPENCSRANLRAWCHPCHCRYDLKQMALKKRLKQEREGQLCIDDPWDEGLQLSLMPGAVAPFSLAWRGEVKREGRSMAVDP